jgi:signal recognition particle subunit SRP54
MASRILDMGDMLTLIEQAERAFDEDQAAKMAGKLASGDGFTLEDFVEQLAMVRKLGPIGNLLGMLPGAAANRELLNQIDDKDLDRAAAIVNSMTPAERRNPKILNGSRRARIANGSGVTVGEVNNLVVRFLEGQKMMRQMMGGGGVPGMPPIPGMRRAVSKSAKKKAKKKPKGGRPGGNPAVGKAGGKPATAPSAGNGNGAGQGAPGLGQGAAALPNSPEDLAASLDALNSNPALRRAMPDLSKLPSPDGAPGAPSGPGSLPAGFGLLGRRRAKKDDDK